MDSHAKYRAAHQVEINSRNRATYALDKGRLSARRRELYALRPKAAAPRVACTDCGRVCRRDGLARHMATRHGEREYVLANRATCPHCNLTFHESYLAKHIRTQHPPPV